jgi:hypothetical protein
MGQLGKMRYRTTVLHKVCTEYSTVAQSYGPWGTRKDAKTVFCICLDHLQEIRVANLDFEPGIQRLNTYNPV